MDIYKIIRESTNTKELLSIEDIDFLFSPVTEKSLFYIINKDDEDTKKFNNIAEKILKKREDYQIAKHKDNLDEFKKEITGIFKSVFKLEKKEKKEELFDYLKNKSEEVSKVVNLGKFEPDNIIYRLFLKEYNTKYAFTWKAFKDVKKEYEKNHTLEGENIYNLKSMIEKYNNIDKVYNNTVFSKENNPFSEKFLEKINDKINS